jgi:hypothetical protein
MCTSTIRLLTLGTLLLGLNGCAGSTYADPGSPEDTGGSGGDSASESSTTRKPTGGELSASGGASQSGSATEAPELLCVPGASDECACPGGAKGAQVCAKDGMSYGACECEPEVVTETVTETKTVAPEGYSGDCLRLGATVATAEGACDLQTPVLYVNCKAKPGPTSVGCRVPYNYALLENVPGVYCCTQ